jgi:hypothetical protein
LNLSQIRTEIRDSNIAKVWVLYIVAWRKREENHFVLPGIRITNVEIRYRITNREVERMEMTRLFICRMSAIFLSFTSTHFSFIQMRFGPTVTRYVCVDQNGWICYKKRFWLQGTRFKSYMRQDYFVNILFVCNYAWRFLFITVSGFCPYFTHTNWGKKKIFL